MWPIRYEGDHPAEPDGTELLWEAGVGDAYGGSELGGQRGQWYGVSDVMEQAGLQALRAEIGRAC